MFLLHNYFKDTDEEEISALQSLQKGNDKLGFEHSGF